MTVLVHVGGKPPVVSNILDRSLEIYLSPNDPRIELIIFILKGPAMVWL